MVPQQMFWWGSVVTYLGALFLASSLSAQIRVGASPPQDIQVKVYGGTARVPLYFDDTVTVGELVPVLAEVTGKNVMLIGEAKEPVTLLARGEFARVDAYEILVSALSTANYEVEHHGPYLRLIRTDLRQQR